MFKKIYLGIIFSLFLVFIYLAFITFQPIRNVSAKEVKSKTGIVSHLAVQNGNLFVSLENDRHIYYVKQYQKQGLDTTTLNQKILKKEITLHHINKWTPLTRDGIHPHISRIEVAGEQIFNEIEE